MSRARFELDKDAYRLRKAGRTLKIERIPMELLLLLAGNPGKLVTRDRIVAHIWGADRFIDGESAINTAVRKLRKLLGDNTSHPRFIETIPGRGYRFIGAKNAFAVTASTTADSGAREYFLRGRHFWNKKTGESYEKALGFFQQAIDKDAAYATSYVGLAHCYIMLGIHGLKAPADVYPKARAAATTALEIDPAMAEAYAALADVSKGYDWDWKTAEEHYLRALRLDSGIAVSHQWYANLLSILNRHEEAIAQAEAGRRLDPLSVGTSGFVGFTLYRARRYDEALLETERTVEFNPRSPIANWFLALVYLHLGRYEEAIASLSRAADGSAASTMYTGTLAFAKARTGRMTEAQQIVLNMENVAATRYVSPIDLAIAHFGISNYATAQAHIQEAVAQRVMRVTELNMPLFDELRRQTWFTGLGLPIPMP